MMDGSSVERTIDHRCVDGIAVVWFDRAHAFNGITNRMARELHELLSTLAADASVAAVVLTGRGKAFCPGADLKHYAADGEDEELRPEHFHVATLLHEMPAVTIAAINGACAGAGLGYALACDLRYASSGAVFNTAFLGVAVAGDMGIPWTLPRIIGAARARELSFFPRKLGAEEAARMGLVNDVFDGDSLLDEVRSRAEELRDRAPLARRSLKEHYVRAERTTFADFITLETDRHRVLVQSSDTREAFQAFVDKRVAHFEGR